MVCADIVVLQDGKGRSLREETLMKSMASVLTLSLSVLAGSTHAAERFFLQCWVSQVDWGGFTEPVQEGINLEVTISRNNRVMINYPQSISCARFKGAADSTSINATCATNLFGAVDVTSVYLNRLDGSFSISSEYVGEYAPYSTRSGFCRKVERLF